MIEPKVRSEIEQDILEGKPSPESHTDAIRMRLTMIATFALIIYIFFSVLF